MSDLDSAYGLWALVLISSAVVIVFAYSFAKPVTRRDWCSFGAFSAFMRYASLVAGEQMEKGGNYE